MPLYLSISPLQFQCTEKVKPTKSFSPPSQISSMCTISQNPYFLPPIPIGTATRLQVSMSPHAFALKCVSKSNSINFPNVQKPVIDDVTEAPSIKPTYEPTPSNRPTRTPHSG